MNFKFTKILTETFLTKFTKNYSISTAALSGAQSGRLYKLINRLGRYVRIMVALEKINHNTIKAKNKLKIL